MNDVCNLNSDIVWKNKFKITPSILYLKGKSSYDRSTQNTRPDPSNGSCIDYGSLRGCLDGNIMRQEMRMGIGIIDGVSFR